jgi:ATP-binding protein involved in chromosome partitioning
VALFNQKGIEVVSGAPVETPQTLVAAFLEGSLQTGQNLCDH